MPVPQLEAWRQMSRKHTLALPAHLVAIGATCRLQQPLYQRLKVLGQHVGLRIGGIIIPLALRRLVGPLGEGRDGPADVGGHPRLGLQSGDERLEQGRQVTLVQSGVRDQLTNPADRPGRSVLPRRGGAGRGEGGEVSVLAGEGGRTEFR